MSLLPPNATPQERALDESTARVGDVAVPLRTLWDPDTCPANLLPWLAWALSVDVWDNSWTEADKRQSIRDAVAIHRFKGTAGAVRRSLAPYNANIVEWFKDTPVGDPYTFIVEPEGVATDEDLTVMIRAVNKSKNVRSHFSFRSAVSGDFKVAGASVAGDIVTIDGTKEAHTYDGSWTYDGSVLLGD